MVCLFIVVCDVMCFCYFAFRRHANDVLRNETTMFEKYLKRVDPKDVGLQQASKYFCRVSLTPKNSCMYKLAFIYLSVSFVKLILTQIIFMIIYFDAPIANIFKALCDYSLSICKLIIYTWVGYHLSINKCEHPIPTKSYLRIFC